MSKRGSEIRKTVVISLCSVILGAGSLMGNPVPNDEDKVKALGPRGKMVVIDAESWTRHCTATDVFTTSRRGRVFAQRRQTGGQCEKSDYGHWGSCG